MTDEDFERLNANTEIAEVICELVDIGGRIEGLSKLLDPGPDGSRGNASERIAAAEAHNSVIASVQSLAELMIEMQPSVDAAKARIDRIKREEG